MWETVAEKGVGGLFKPWQMRREGRASIELKREELLSIAQAEHEVKLLRTSQNSTSSVSPRIAQDAPASRESDQAPFISLERRAKDELILEEIRLEANVTRALLHAEDVLSDDAQLPPEEKVDDDWLFRWRDSAAQVSAEGLQNLWGRVLAGEGQGARQLLFPHVGIPQEPFSARSGSDRQALAVRHRRRDLPRKR